MSQVHRLTTQRRRQVAAHPEVARCRCVETSIFAYPDEDGDVECARCGRQLPVATGGVDPRLAALTARAA